MRFLRFTLMAVIAAAVSAFAAVPASAQVPPSNPKAPGLQQNVSCPTDGSITLSKTADRAEYNVNAIVTFTLTVHVDSCNTAGVAVHDQLPPGLTVSDPSVLTHSYGAIAAGGDGSYTFQAKAVAKGTWTNQAQAVAVFVGSDRGECGPPQQQASAARVEPPPFHACRKSANAQVTVKVIDPSGRPTPTPTPTPTPSQPSSPKAPSLPNTGRQE
jgi:uncharacterized repeat protein (TIGR01451 family)